MCLPAESPPVVNTQVKKEERMCAFKSTVYQAGNVIKHRYNKKKFVRDVSPKSASLLNTVRFLLSTVLQKD